MNSELAKATARTTIQHLGGWNRLSVMIGAPQYMVGPNGEASFTFKRGKQSINHVKISLVNDLYVLNFNSMVRGKGLVGVKTIEGVYADNLRRVFEETTGLVLSL